MASVQGPIQPSVPSVPSSLPPPPGSGITLHEVHYDIDLQKDPCPPGKPLEEWMAEKAYGTGWRSEGIKLPSEGAPKKGAGAKIKAAFQSFGNRLSGLIIGADTAPLTFRVYPKYSSSVPLKSAYGSPLVNERGEEVKKPQMVINAKMVDGKKMAFIPIEYRMEVYDKDGKPTTLTATTELDTGIEIREPATPQEMEARQLEMNATMLAFKEKVYVEHPERSREKTAFVANWTFTSSHPTTPHDKLEGAAASPHAAWSARHSLRDLTREATGGTPTSLITGIQLETKYRDKLLFGGTYEESKLCYRPLEFARMHDPIEIRDVDGAPSRQQFFESMRDAAADCAKTEEGDAKEALQKGLEAELSASSPLQPPRQQSDELITYLARRSLEEASLLQKRLFTNKLVSIGREGDVTFAEGYQERLKSLAASERTFQGVESRFNAWKGKHEQLENELRTAQFLRPGEQLTTDNKKRVQEAIEKPLKELKSQKDKAQKEVDSFKETLKELETTKKELEAAQKELAAIPGKLAALTPGEEQQKLEAKAKELETKVPELQTKVKDLEAKAIDLPTKIAEGDAKVKDLETRLKPFQDLNMRVLFSLSGGDLSLLREYEAAKNAHEEFIGERDFNSQLCEKYQRSRAALNEVLRLFPVTEGRKLPPEADAALHRLEALEHNLDPNEPFDLSTLPERIQFVSSATKKLTGIKEITLEEVT